MSTHYLELIRFKSYADLRSEAARTYLSFLWWILDPILSMSVYYVVFGLLLQRGHEHYVPFLLIGLTSWNWFGNTARAGMNTIYSNRQITSQVYVPKIVFPSITIVTNTFKFAIVFLLVVLFVWIYGFDITAAYWALPVILATQLLFLTSVTFLLAGILPFLPDIRYLVNSLLMMMFFLSGIFYSGSSIPESYQPYFYLNPMAVLLESYRDVLMYHSLPDLQSLAVIALGSLALAYVVARLIARFDSFYAQASI